jgi:hypothetical protein
LEYSTKPFWFADWLDPTWVTEKTSEPPVTETFEVARRFEEVNTLVTRLFHRPPEMAVFPEEIYEPEEAPLLTELASVNGSTTAAIAEPATATAAATPTIEEMKVLFCI